MERKSVWGALSVVLVKLGHTYVRAGFWLVLASITQIDLLYVSQSCWILPCFCHYNYSLRVVGNVPEFPQRVILLFRFVEMFLALSLSAGFSSISRICCTIMQWFTHNDLRYVSFHLWNVHWIRMPQHHYPHIIPTSLTQIIAPFLDSPTTCPRFQTSPCVPFGSALREMC